MAARQTIVIIFALGIVVSDAYVIKAILWQRTTVSSKAEITCWTCPNMTNNEACNDWAPNIHCPHDHTICLTSHTIDYRTGNSINVHKRCALPKQCNSHVIGCRHGDAPHIQTCTSCCAKSYCNERVPHDHETALTYSTLEAGSSSRVSFVSVPIVLLLLLTNQLLSSP